MKFIKHTIFRLGIPVLIFTFVFFIAYSVLSTKFFLHENRVIPDFISQEPENNKHEVVSDSSNSTDSGLLLENIFTYADPEISFSGQKQENEITLLVTGDVIPARSVNSIMTSKNNFIFPFEKTAGLLNSADLVFANLETPLMKNCKPVIDGMTFCGSPRAVEGLLYAGIDIVSLANNHTANFGREGVDETIRILEEKGIKVTGLSGRMVIEEIKGKKFAFLAYSEFGGSAYGISAIDEKIMKKEIREAQGKSDFVIVMFHWGQEYVSIPGDNQKSLAHLAIDEGADLVVGNHPHWVQGIENYKGKFITYAHGNFLFDQMWSLETRQGVIGKYTFNSERLKSIEFYPIIIDSYSVTRFATLQEAPGILGRMKESTEQIGGN